MNNTIPYSHYTFDKANKKITFTDFAGIDLGRLKLITDVTNNVIIYQFNNPLKGGTVNGNVLTLTYDTTGSAFNNTDFLFIVYESQVDDPIYSAMPVINAKVEEYQDIDRQTLKVTNPAFVNAFQATGAIATNSVIAPTHDIGDISFMSVTVNTGGAWTAAIKVQQSDDQSLWTDSLIFNTASLDTPPATTITANGRYLIRKTGRYMKIFYSSFTSGAAATATVEYFTTPYSDFQRFTSANPMPVSLSTLPSISGTVSVSNFPATQPVSAASLPLPTGAATEATLASFSAAAATSANQATANTSLATIATNTGRIPSVGQATKSASAPVVLASDQDPLKMQPVGSVVTGLTAGALNDKLVADIDVSAVGSFSLQIGGTFTASLTFAGSNDGTQFFNAPVISITSANSATAATQTATGIYTGNCPFKYLRVYVSAYTSGSITGTLYTSTEARPLQTFGILAAQGNAGSTAWLMTDRGATPTITRPATGTTSASILASNTSRKQAVVVNDSAANLYILFGSGTASTTNYTYKLAAGADKAIDKYTGAITGVLDSGTGSAQVTEVA